MRLTVSVPSQFKVAASGHADGADWVVDTPTPPFLFAFAAGEFTESSKKVDGVTLRVLGDAGKVDVFENTAAAMKFLVERSGKAYPGLHSGFHARHGGAGSSGHDIAAGVLYQRLDSGSRRLMAAGA